MCVPNTLRNTVFYFCHDVPVAGHMGVEKTLARVLQRYWWYRVTVDGQICPFLYLLSITQTPDRYSVRPSSADSLSVNLL